MWYRIMATGRLQNQPAESLRKQLALAVKSIQWSYAIFWSISCRQPGVLEWIDGYYNGDIKTRKTIQAAEPSADQLELQRSEQLRELYESLSAADTSPQAKRPSVALSPEDLTDTEWYFLVCMSFVFITGQGLPGRTLAKNQITWLCNAHQADSKVFPRSLLAKSASIQTVVCFPHLGGVVELGVTEPVVEDRNLIRHIKSAFLDNPYPVISKIPHYVPNTNDKDIVVCGLDDDMIEANFEPLVECEDVKICSPSNSTTGFEDADQQAQNSHMMEGISDEACHVQSWQFMDDEISNCIHDSMNSGDCTPQTYANGEKGVPLSNEETVNHDFKHDLQECNLKKLDHFNFRSDDAHYQGVLSALLKSSHQLILGPYFTNSDQESSFVSWKIERPQFVQKQGAMSQRVLKSVVFEVPRMHGDWKLKSSKGYGKRESIWRPEADEIDNNHVLAERKRREKLNERFMMLGSLVPSNGKLDKVSILDGAIDYLKELERRVEELESVKEAIELEARTKRLQQEATERTSGDYVMNKVGKSRRPVISKRKASNVEEIEAETNYCTLTERSSDDLTVRVINRNALIELKCPWTESVFCEIMEAVSKLNLDSHTVQSSNTDGTLTVKIRAKFKGSKVATPGMIRRALQRVLRKY